MKKIENWNKHLGAEERAMIMLMKLDGSGVRETARFLKRSPSTISRELGRDLGGESDYVASLAGAQACQRRSLQRKTLKLVSGSPLFVSAP